MARASRSFFFALTLSLLAFISTVRAEISPDPDLAGVLQKIESRHYRWIAIRADVLLFFAKTGDPNAMCGGELLYQRLDERMLLTCVDARQELMFVFRTFDRRFDLYLPDQNTVYHGSIFDLEDSPDIESHLKARDLYRALKPLAIDPRRAKIERTNSAITSLDIYGRNETADKIVRKLYLTPEGDVRGELFYNTQGRPVTEIQRYDFREFRGQAGAYASILFPKKVTITSPETKKGSAIFFTRVTARDTIDPLDFILRIPPGTKEVFLEEKNPRYQTPKPAETALVPASVAPGKTVPVYLAKPLKRSAEKTTPPSVKKEKETPVIPEPATKPKSEVPDEPPVKSPEETTALDSADADIALDDKSPTAQSSTSNDLTTLDPSVDPTV